VEAATAYLEVYTIENATLTAWGAQGQGEVANVDGMLWVV
jgi:hypothetical protein